MKIANNRTTRVRPTSPLFLIACCCALSTVITHAAQMGGVAESDKTERSVAASPNVIVSLCVASGNITTRGSDKAEVRVTSSEDAHLELRSSGGAQSPAQRVEVIISSQDNRPSFGECTADGDIELFVPRGAIVQLKTRDGDIAVRDVGEARLETMSGNIVASGVARGIEASALSGDIKVSDAGGGINLHAISGDIEANDLRQLDNSNELEARSISGDVSIENVTHQRIEANTVSGDVTLELPQIKTGRYNAKTTSGDITMSLAADSSFQVSAKVSQGDIINDYTLKTTDSAGARADGRRLNGVSGSGEATITLYSFSGAIHLRRK